MKTKSQNRETLKGNDFINKCIDYNLKRRHKQLRSILLYNILIY